MAPFAEVSAGNVAGPLLNVSAWSVSASDSVDAGLAVVSVSPSDGTVVTASPATVAVTFDRPVDPFSFGFSDVRFMQFQGGTWVNAFTDASVPAQQLDDAGTTLIVTPSSPLPPGRYRLMIPSDSPLSGADGTPLAGAGTDEWLGGFTVKAPVAPGLSLADAKDLGALGGGTVKTSGSLDLAADPSAERLYKFAVPAGHHWRLLAEVNAQRSGSPLQSTLALFGPDGTLIKAASVGRSGAVNDPYFFAGLEPGTYYVGLSAAGNVPGQPGGYDPVSGTRGVDASGRTGGSFSLRLTADLADAPTKALGFVLNYADPLDAAPTGFTMAFSGPLDVNTLRNGSGTGVVLVGADGVVWPVTATGLNEASARYEFTFDQRLPAGKYTIRAAEQGGVTDLAGLTPVGSDGNGRDLGNFTVPSAAKSSDSRNLGPLFAEVDKGLGRADAIPAGTAVSYRFVILADGLFQFATRTDGGSLSFQLLGGGKATRYDVPAVATTPIFLKAGVYVLQLTNPNHQELVESWRMSRSAAWDSLLDNGVGQGPAADLRLVNPTTAEFGTTSTAGLAGPGSPSPGPSFTGPGSPAGPSFFTPSPGPGGLGVVSGPTASSPSGDAVGYVAPALSLSVGGAPVGGPSAHAEHVAAVGPASGSGGVAVASVGEGLLPGIRYESTSGQRGRVVRPRNDLANPEPPASPDAPTNGAMAAAAESAPRPAPKDDLVVAAVDWLARLRARVQGLVQGDASEVADPGAEALLAEALPVVEARDAAAGEEGRVEQAQIETPLVVIVSSVLAMRYHSPLRHWLARQNRSNGSSRKSSRSQVLRGPHKKV